MIEIEEIYEKISDLEKFVKSENLEEMRETLDTNSKNAEEHLQN